MLPPPQSFYYGRRRRAKRVSPRRPRKQIEAIIPKIAHMIGPFRKKPKIRPFYIEDPAFTKRKQSMRNQGHEQNFDRNKNSISKQVDKNVAGVTEDRIMRVITGRG